MDPFTLFDATEPLLKSLPSLGLDRLSQLKNPSTWKFFTSLASGMESGRETLSVYSSSPCDVESSGGWDDEDVVTPSPPTPPRASLTDCVSSEVLSISSSSHANL